MSRSMSTLWGVVDFDKSPGTVEGSKVSERVPLSWVGNNDMGLVLVETGPILANPSWKES
jgi:hypothetical protein